MKKNYLVAVSLGILAAILYLASMANFAFPGESASLMVCWRGIDVPNTPPYPLMAIFAKLFGGGNLLAPICGALSVYLLFRLVSTFVFWRGGDTHATAVRAQLALVAGATAAVVFMTTPAVRAAATHLEPRMFDFTWAILSFSLALPFRHTQRAFWVFPLAIGVMAVYSLP